MNYLEKVFREKTQLRAEEMPIDSLQDLYCFQAMCLDERPDQERGYSIEILDGVVMNHGFSVQNMVIRKIETESN